MTKADKKGQKKAPILRFKGFTDDWEQRKLKNLITEPLSYGLNVSSKEYDGIHKYLRITDIDEKSRKFNKDKLTSPDIKFNSSSKKYLLSNNDIVFARTGASTGKTYMYQKEDGIVYYAGFLIKASLSSNFDNNFIFQQTYRKRYYQRVKVISQRSGQPGINSKEYGNFDFLITQIEEQNKIGKLFKIFDNLLALYERKVKLLLQIKKYLLNNLFSEKEYPDLRFKYSKKDNWKKISLSSVLTYKNGKAHEKEINNKGNLDLVMMNSITTEGRLITKKKIFSPQDTLSKNDIVIVLSDIAKGELIGKSSVIPCDDQYVLNQRIGCLRPTSNIDSFFVSKYINQKSQYFKSHAAGTSQINLSKSDVLNCTIYIPNIDEQHYVSNFIINIEKNINFYKDKKQCFIEIKNTLLNNMFI